ncbi:MAG: hypothetical protein J6V22_06810, partial [Clostridia bacterium]|nr:hypothetical protein [Clostridia bacterium]
MRKRSLRREGVPMTDFSYVDQNLAEIRARIDAASKRSGG